FIALKSIPEKIWQNVHQQGIDRRQGETIVPQGRMLSPAEIAVAAAIGKVTVHVYAHPRIAIVSTGDELVEISETPLPHQIRRSNAAMLQAFLRARGLECKLFHTGDASEAMHQCFADLLQDYDVIISTGSVSAGEVDILPSVLQELGVEVHFHKVAQRPGKPMLFGQTQTCTVFALPGNPVSAVLCFLRYVWRWICAAQGQEKSKPLFAQLTEPVVFKPKLTYFLPVRLAVSSEATLLAEPLAGHGSGDFANLVDCDGFLELPAEKSEFVKGEAHPVWLYRDWC
ncbi:MAG: molybdopterin molybdotransferase MoeA, partial [Chloroherpetonaceae bacterium]|nr:molybdopterin molybdotransferase MoeA [Chloroherpetonaceae bacterium]